MKLFRFYYVFLLAAISVFIAPAYGQTVQQNQDPKTLLRVAAGSFNEFKSKRNGAVTVDLTLPYSIDLPYDWWFVQPFVGAMITSKNAAYGYAGFKLDYPMNENIYLTPSFAPGLFSHGDGKDLGYWIEFRSGMEVSWKFDNNNRLGLEVAHISNAGLSNKNPGVELLTLSWTYPL